jgi:hypothetical protein
LDIAENLSRNISCDGLNPAAFGVSAERGYMELFSEYAHFMNVYCSTVMLVLALYFENPFNKKEDLEDGPKRPLAAPCQEESSED